MVSMTRLLPCLAPPPALDHSACIAGRLTLLTNVHAHVKVPGAMLGMPVACVPAQHMTCQMCMLAGCMVPLSCRGTATPSSLMLHSCCHSCPL